MCVCVFVFCWQLIPAISSLSWFTTAVPLILVLSITAVKDASDDIVSWDNNLLGLNSRGILLKIKTRNKFKRAIWSKRHT